jgi:hypothetical protein
MENGNYIRGNGAVALKKRFSVIKIAGKLVMYAILPVFYVILQSQVKLISRGLERAEYSSQMMKEELERLNSDYEKMVSYSEVKDYAEKEFSMVQVSRKVICFSVLDKSGIIKTKHSVRELPQLFDTRINLALVSEEKPETAQR